MSGLGGCLNCCSPVAKCPMDEVGNGRIMGIGGMGRMAEARLALRRLCARDGREVTRDRRGMGWRLVGCAWGPLTNAVGGGGSALERQEGWNGVNGAGFGANPAVFGAGGGCDWGRWGVGRWAMGREERPLSREPADSVICYLFFISYGPEVGVGGKSIAFS